ncbi:hypothetical protein AURDEDRAFT_32516, partial [Auricularia subglabra TFB-10046 SS5]
TQTSASGSQQPAQAKAATAFNGRSRGSHDLGFGAKLTAQQQAEHRAQNLCFYCHKPGHLAADCHSRRQANRSGAR